MGCSLATWDLEIARIERRRVSVPHSWKAFLLDFQHHVDEMFEELIYRRWAIPNQPGWRPVLDVHETPDAYLVEVDLPGVAPEEVQVLVSERSVTVRGQRQVAAPEGSLWNRRERVCGSFHRSVELSHAVDPDHSQAEFRHGTCRILLPKKRAEGEKAKEATPGTAESYRVLQVSVR
jgi:HSP20 family protein